jgi:hypothetical protein
LSDEASAHEGTPIPVLVPVEMKGPQVAHADEHRIVVRIESREQNKARFISFSPKDMLRAHLVTAPP